MQIPRHRLVLYGVLYVNAMLFLGGAIALAVTHFVPGSPLHTPLAMPLPATVLPTFTPRVMSTAGALSTSILLPPTSTPPATFTPIPTAACYTIQRGDTITGVARRHNVKPAAIVNANPWLRQRKNYKIYPGECLVIPR
jgi:LysM repeat protein